MMMQTLNSPVRRSLTVAVAVPAIYFGVQLLAAPFYPGYSFNLQAASMLGSNYSQYPMIFNIGAILTGVAALIGAGGIAAALRRRGVAVALCGVIALCVAVLGVTSIKAGLFPLPDPRHSSWQALTVFLLGMPVLFLAALWKQRDARAMKVYLGISIAAMFLLIPLLSEAVRIPGLGGGTIQRMFAATIFVPVAVMGWFLGRRG
jgi:hypothetical membrane protein